MTYPPPASDSALPYVAQPGPGGHGSPRKRLRGRIPLRLALIFGVIGLALAISGGVVIAKKSLGLVDQFTRVTFAEGSKTVHLSRTGSYVGYYEAPGTNRSSSGPFVRLGITATDGTPVQISIYGRNGSSTTSLTYSYDGHDGQALFQFKIERAGDYAVRVASPDRVPAGADIALGKSIGRGLAVGIVLLVPGILLIIAAIVLLIVGLVRRSGHKRELGNPPPYYGGGPWPGQPAPGQWPGPQPGPGYGGQPTG